MAEKHGLLKLEIRHEPCGEGASKCNCLEAFTAADFTKGVPCYRRTLLLAATRGSDS